MGTRKYKCYYCKKTIENDDELMEITYGKNNSKKRCHISCHNFATKEREELDSLVVFLKKLYNITIIPSSFYIRLQDIRNGNDIYNKVKTKKVGYKYKFIEHSYKKHIKEIEKTKTKVQGGINGQLLYGLAIVRNNINDDVAELKAKHKRKKELQEIKNQTIVTQIEKEVKITTKKKEAQYDWL